jgi:hypothetical protein
MVIPPTVTDGTSADASRDATIGSCAQAQDSVT